MRPIARQSARLASSCQARASSVPRHRASKQHRAFHVSTQRSEEPRPPNGSGHLGPWHDNARSPEVEPQKHDEGTELEIGEAKAGSEVRKGRTRTTLRQRRMNDVPKPPPVPEWFLKHNVRLVEERHEQKWREESEYQTIRCVDTETGHTLFTVEHYQPMDMRSKAKPKKVLHDEEPQSHNHTTSEEPSAPSPSNEANSALDQHFFDPKYATSSSTTQTKPEDSEETLFVPPSRTHSDPHVRASIATKEWDIDPMRWPFLEAETSVRAALALDSASQPASTFATDRVDLSLECPDLNSHEQMDVFVSGLARVVGADLIRLDANDLAELSDEYVGLGDDTPGSISNLAYEVYDGFVASGVPQGSPFRRMPPRQDDEDEYDEEEEADEDEQRGGPAGGLGSFMGVENLKKLLQSGSLGKATGGQIVGIGIGNPFSDRAMAGGRPDTKQSIRSSAFDANRDDARLTALLESLLNSARDKRVANASLDRSTGQQVSKDDASSWHEELRSFRSTSSWHMDTADLLLAHLGSILQGDDPTKFPYQLFQGPQTANPEAEAVHKTIIHVRDLRDICNSRLGENVIRRLSKVVRKRRRSGERVMIVGSTAQDVTGHYDFPGDHQDDSFFFRNITIPPRFSFMKNDRLLIRRPRLEEKSLDDPGYSRIVDINLRHIETMLRRVKPNQDLDLCSAVARKQLNMPGTHLLTERVLPMDQVQRLALTAVGLMQTHAKSDTVHPIHVALAAFVTSRADHVQHCWSLIKEKKDAKTAKSDGGLGEQASGQGEGESGQDRIERIKKSLNQHESKLLTGVVNGEKIKVGFGDVHAASGTIEALKTATSLSLLRPDAFKYGVLANDRLPGLLLYGPPGTGKTLLAKAVAKESKATVLEVSGAQIYEKYVGEGEKMVRAVFSLAKKLSPCVVFIDEADAIFGSRSNAGNRNTHREIINQFLREWDGMDDHGCFMMVATNRPFDLDDAVLRRLPRRLLVDLPVAKDRESILGIHLRNEALDSSVSLANLAEQTPFYSGSDLKNLSVAAALACVREENEFAEIRKDDTEFKFPEKRILTTKHFDKALAEISASISEDMSSLSAIRKFDEQYGDRKGRRKKTGYGFGLADDAVNESAARVRQDSASSPPP